MTIIEASEVLGLKVRTIREWVKLVKIKAKKVGKEWIISDEVVYSREVMERANKGREHSRRIEKGIKLGVCQQDRQDSKKSV
jgi:excisionase family DNA binding protein